MQKIKMISYDGITISEFREQQVPTMIRRGWKVCDDITETKKPAPTKPENK